MKIKTIIGAILGLCGYYRVEHLIPLEAIQLAMMIERNAENDAVREAARSLQELLRSSRKLLLMKAEK